MPTIPFLTDRRIWLLALVVLLAVLVGFHSVPDYAAIVFVSNAGFWFVLTAFALWIHALWTTFRPDLRFPQWREMDWPTIALIAAAGTVLLVHESFGFKIVMDEIMLLGASMSMHLDKTVLVPVRGQGGIL